jgi:hypothetical protein
MHTIDWSERRRTLVERYGRIGALATLFEPSRPLAASGLLAIIRTSLLRANAIAVPCLVQTCLFGLTIVNGEELPVSYQRGVADGLALHV